MGGYAVDPAELARVDALLADCAAQGRAALATLRGSAEALLGGRWRGPGGAATSGRPGTTGTPPPATAGRAGRAGRAVGASGTRVRGHRHVGAGGGGGGAGMTRLVVDLAALAELVDRMQRFQDHLSSTRDEVERRVADLHADVDGHGRGRARAGTAALGRGERASCTRRWPRCARSG